MSNSAQVSLSTAHQLLKQWDCLHSQSEATPYPELRDALRTVAAHCDNQILGICAGSLAEGRKALSTYAQALGHSVDMAKLQDFAQDEAASGSVYIKHNPASGLLYASDYEGTHRGVLISCQSDTASGLNEMYGHLPLDLFAEV